MPLSQSLYAESAMLLKLSPLAQVVTKRTKNLKKQEIPSLDDPIAKLNHIGKETVKKLNELKFSADEVQLELNLPPELHRCWLHPWSRTQAITWNTEQNASAK